MKITFKNIVLIFGILCSPVLSATTCIDPFPFLEKNETSGFQKFILQEVLSCNKETLRIGLTPVKSSEPYFHTPGVGSIYFSSECVEQKKGTYLYHNRDSGNGRDILYQSEAMDGNPNLFKIRVTCNNKTIAILDTSSKMLSVNGKEIAASLSIYTDDLSQSLIGYIPGSENREESVTLFNHEGNTLAIAMKTFYQYRENICYANWWVVNNNALDPSILSYFLTIKDNMNLNCGPAPSPSSGLLIAGGVFAAAAFTISAAILYKILPSHQPGPSDEGDQLL